MSTNYLCSISFDGANKVKTTWAPAQPDEFANADNIHFISAEGPWKVGFKESPFVDDPEGSVRSFQEAAGQADGSTLERAGKYPFFCGILQGATWVGYGDEVGGGQVNVGK